MQKILLLKLLYNGNSKKWPYLYHGSVSDKDAGSWIQIRTRIVKMFMQTYFDGKINIIINKVH